MQKMSKTKKCTFGKIEKFCYSLHLSSLLTNYQRNSNIKGKIKTNGHFENKVEVNEQKRQN